MNAPPARIAQARDNTGFDLAARLAEIDRICLPAAEAIKRTRRIVNHVLPLLPAGGFMDGEDASWRRSYRVHQRNELAKAIMPRLRAKIDARNGYRQTCLADPYAGYRDEYRAPGSYVPPLGSEWPGNAVMGGYR